MPRYRVHTGPVAGWLATQRCERCDITWLAPVSQKRCITPTCRRPTKFVKSDWVETSAKGVLEQAKADLLQLKTEWDAQNPAPKKRRKRRAA